MRKELAKRQHMTRGLVMIRLKAPLRRKEKERQCDHQQTAAHNDEADPPGANEARVVVGDARIGQPYDNVARVAETSHEAAENEANDCWPNGGAALQCTAVALRRVDVCLGAELQIGRRLRTDLFCQQVRTGAVNKVRRGGDEAGEGEHQFAAGDQSSAVEADRQKVVAMRTALICTSRSIGKVTPKKSASVNISRARPDHCLVILPTLVSLSSVFTWKTTSLPQLKVQMGPSILRTVLSGGVLDAELGRTDGPVLVHRAEQLAVDAVHLEVLKTVHTGVRQLLQRNGLRMLMISLRKLSMIFMSKERAAPQNCRFKIFSKKLTLNSKVDILAHDIADGVLVVGLPAGEHLQHLHLLLYQQLIYHGEVLQAGRNVRSDFFEMPPSCPSVKMNGIRVQTNSK
ncbi:hypothetical protein TYRP_003095 [Tyrophagus putrescentiae]|nr:hypothetical protein TYRP_003095 [Tyrophagus putrescentiae]